MTEPLKYYIVENITEIKLVAIYPSESINTLHPGYKVLYGPFDTPEEAVRRATKHTIDKRG